MAINKIITAFLLAALMLNSMISCSTKQPSLSESTSTSVLSETSTEQAETKVELGFKKTDFKDQKFNILYYDWGLYTNYFFAEEQTGDQMNDAIYERKLKTEEYLGVDIVSQPANGITEPLKKSVFAETDDFQLVLTHCMDKLADMLTSGLLYDWQKLPYIDMSKDYWNKNAIENLSVYGHSYYAISDFMIADPNAILFNKQMIDNYKLENPYELVKNGEWTLDKLISMSDKVSGDLNGDGVYDVNDLYGLAVEGDWVLNSIQYGCDQYLVNKNADGTYSLVMNNEKMYSIVEKIHNFLMVGHNAFTWTIHAEDEDKILIGSDRTLFYMTPLHDISNLRTGDVDFGILPFPKYDIAQKDYISNDWSGLMCIPLTVVNTDLVGMTNEALAFYSGDTTIPAYYDVLLKGKLARDNESVDMLDIIYGNVVYDAGMNYFGCTRNIFELFYSMMFLVINNDSADFASWYAKYEAPAIKEMDNFLEKAAKIPQ